MFFYYLYFFVCLQKYAGYVRSHHTITQPGKIRIFAGYWADEISTGSGSTGSVTEACCKGGVNFVILNYHYIKLWEESATDEPIGMQRGRVDRCLVIRH